MRKQTSIPAILLAASFLAVLFLPVPAWYLLPRPADPNPPEKAAFPRMKEHAPADYPRRIEQWCNVFLPYHHTLSGANHRICGLLGLQPVPQVVRGEDGWFFYNTFKKSAGGQSVSEMPYYDYMGTNLYSSGQLAHILNNLKNFREKLASENIA